MPISRLGKLAQNQPCAPEHYLDDVGIKPQITFWMLKLIRQKKDVSKS